MKNLFVLLLLTLVLASCNEYKKMMRSSEKLATTDVFGEKIDKINDYQPSATREFDLIHTKLEVSFDMEKQHLLGVATLTVKPYFYETSTLKLDAKGFDIHQVAKITTKREGQDMLEIAEGLEYNYDDELILEIQLDKAYTRNDELTIEIEYTAKPNDLDRLGNDAITEDKGLYFIDPLDEDENKPTQIWTQGEPEASSCWFPTIDKPNERTTQEIYITVEDKYVTLSNGMLVTSVKNNDGTRTDYWKQNIPHAPYLFMMGIGEFAIVKDKWKNIEVNYYVEPEYEEFADDIFGDTPEMLDFYSNIFGYVYPWEKYSQIVVRDFVSGAMENTTATIHYEGLHRDDRQLLDQTHEDIIAHELVHQWFGDLVTCESWANIALNESFATYGEILWWDYKHGEWEGQYQLYVNTMQYFREAMEKQKPLIRFFHDHPNSVFDRHSYQKGSVILSMLRDYVGDEAFFASLQHYLKENSYKPAEAHQLRLAFEEITGEDLNWFFNQWFYQAGHPILEISHKNELGDLRLTVKQKASTMSDFLYKLPIDVEVHYPDTVFSKRIVLTAAEESFDVRTYRTEDPVWVNFDVNKTLLAEKNEKKSTAEWINQYRKAKNYHDAHEALDHLSLDMKAEGVMAVFEDALDHDFWAVREYAIVMLGEAGEEHVTNKLMTMAREDDKSSVREVAIDVLSDLNAKGKDFEDMLKEAVNDRSYRVGSQALVELTKLDEDDALEMVEGQNLQDSKDGSMLTAVGYVYSETGAEGKVDFYENQLKKVPSFHKYVLLYYYGSYLGKRGEAEISRGLKTINYFAEGDNDEAEWLTDAGIGSMDRLKASLENRKIKAQSKLKSTDEVDLKKIGELEDEIDMANKMINLVNQYIGKLDDKNEG